ncbi:hypothetical protein CYY_005401 [Polysphondylium violaceum]|uniref:Uncharacterized protein n=1 Tax=Polysphondylium violaceum TaxID=133409 RepID=A0A8J4PTT9_9MYCE|nr:hypothetical protein CYY_005401 [Polysphondylium violaceum]
MYGLAGSHEKGFIGIDVTDPNQWRGAWIQHSFPRFPVLLNKRRGVVSFVPPLKYRFSDALKAAAPYLGWYRENAFFNSNLLAKMNLDNKKRKKNNNNNSDNDDDFSNGEKNTIESQIDKLNNIINTYRFGEDIYFRAALYDGGTRSQHAFCVSINHQGNFEEFFQYMSMLSGDFLNGMPQNLVHLFQDNAYDFNPYVKPADDGPYIRRSKVRNLLDGVTPLPTANYLGQVESKIFNFNLVPGDPDYYDALDPNQNLFYMKINTAATQTNDVWKTMALCTPGVHPEPCLNRPAAGQLEPFTVATWVKDDGDRWWRGVFTTPTFLIQNLDFGGGVTGSHSWDGNTILEHSKIGWRHIVPAAAAGGAQELWNVCFSGGNLIPQRNKSIKSSVLVCFKSDALRLFLNGLVAPGHENMVAIKRSSKAKKEATIKLSGLLFKAGQEKATSHGRIRKQTDIYTPHSSGLGKSKAVTIDTPNKSPRYDKVKNDLADLTLKATQKMEILVPQADYDLAVNHL